MRRFGLKQAKFTDDRGAALGMVLIMIVFLSVLVVSVSFLTQSTSKSVAINSAETAKRSELVNSGFSQALNYLAQPNSSGQYYGSEELPCGDIPSKYDITISCTQAPRSGVNDALGSLVLTGTCTPSETCTTGVHGGLDIQCQLDGCPETGTSATNRLKITGGIVNSSGSYVNASPYTLALVTRVGQDEPQLVNPEIEYQPNGTINSSGCPTWSFSAIKCDDPRYRPCPVVWVTDDSDSSIDGEYADECVTSTKLNPNPTVALPTTKVKNYLDYRYGTTANTAHIKNIAPQERTAATMVKSGSTCTWSYTSGKAGLLNYIRYSQQQGASTPLDTLIDATCTKVVFTPGTYYFDDINPFVWNIPSGVTVIGGVPLGNSCDPTKAGVQFIFGGKTRINLHGGAMSLCSQDPEQVTYPVIATLPADIKGVFEYRTLTKEEFDRNESGWYVEDDTAFLTVDGLSAGSSVDGPARWSIAKNDGGHTSSTLHIHGSIVAPAGAADLFLTPSTLVSIDGGAIFRAARIYEGGGSFTTSGTDMPKSYNGDRVVQLKFWRGTNLSKANRTQEKILGFVQVRIYDYFGLKPNSGYKILTWRAAW